MVENLAILKLDCIGISLKELMNWGLAVWNRRLEREYSIEMCIGVFMKFGVQELGFQATLDPLYTL